MNAVKVKGLVPPPDVALKGLIKEYLKLSPSVSLQEKSICFTFPIQKYPSLGYGTNSGLLFPPASAGSGICA